MAPAPNIEGSSTYGISQLQFVRLAVHWLPPLAAILLAWPALMLVLVAYRALTHDWSSASSTEIGLEVALALFVVAWLLATVWAVFRQPWVGMELGGPLQLEVSEDGLVVQGSRARREYGWHDLDHARIGDFVRVRGGHYFVPDFIPAALLPEEVVRAYAAAGRAAPVQVAPAYDMTLSSRGFAREWAASARSPRTLWLLALASVVMAGSFHAAATHAPVLFCLAGGIVAGLMIWATSPLFASLYVRGNPYYGTTATPTDAGLLLQRPGYREVVPWSSFSSVEPHADGPGLHMAYCRLPLRHHADADEAARAQADALVARHVPVRGARDGSRGAAAARLVPALLIAACIGFVLAAGMRPGLVGAGYWDGVAYQHQLAWLAEAVLVGIAIGFVFAVLFAALGVRGRRRRATRRDLLEPA